MQVFRRATLIVNRCRPLSSQCSRSLSSLYPDSQVLRTHPTSPQPKGFDRKTGCCACIFQGVPSKAYKLPASWLKEGSAVINVSTFKNVDEGDVLKVRSVYGEHFRSYALLSLLLLHMLFVSRCRSCWRRGCRGWSA